MFMTAVARPRLDPNKKQYFNSKFRIWPFVYQEAAKKFKNRPKEIMVTKVKTSVDKQKVEKMIVDNVFPAIREKFPTSCKNKVIYIQKDNAKPHCSQDKSTLVEEGIKDVWCIRMSCQPPNSPNMNVLDLSFFNAIQSLHHKCYPKSFDELIRATTNAFWSTTRETLENTFLTIQTCMEATMKCGGGNRYKVVHMRKEKLCRKGRLPISIL